MNTVNIIKRWNTYDTEHKVHVLLVPKCESVYCHLIQNIYNIYNNIQYLFWPPDTQITVSDAKPICCHKLFSFHCGRQITQQGLQDGVFFSMVSCCLPSSDDHIIFQSKASCGKSVSSRAALHNKIVLHLLLNSTRGVHPYIDYSCFFNVSQPKTKLCITVKAPELSPMLRDVIFFSHNTNKLNFEWWLVGNLFNDVSRLLWPWRLSLNNLAAVLTYFLLLFLSEVQPPELPENLSYFCFSDTLHSF